MLCGSPELIERVGRPTRPEQLTALPCIIDTNNRSRNNWQFYNENGPTLSVQVSGKVEINSPLTTRRAVLAGLGFGSVPDFVVKQDIETGRLISILDEFALRDGGIYAVYPHRRYLPAKVRVLVDYLAKWFKDNRNV